MHGPTCISSGNLTPLSLQPSALPPPPDAPAPAPAPPFAGAAADFPTLGGAGAGPVRHRPRPDAGRGPL
jgi:hypothetical protein